MRPELSNIILDGIQPTSAIYLLRNVSKECDFEEAAQTWDRAYFKYFIDMNEYGWNEEMWFTLVKRKYIPLLVWICRLPKMGVEEFIEIYHQIGLSEHIFDLNNPPLLYWVAKYCSCIFYSKEIAFKYGAENHPVLVHIKPGHDPNCILIDLLLPLYGAYTTKNIDAMKILRKKLLKYCDIPIIDFYPDDMEVEDELKTKLRLACDWADIPYEF